MAFPNSKMALNDKELLKNVAVDNVIFGYHEKELKILLQQPMGFRKWTVTGGYIKRTESIDQAAKRVAQDRTGISDLYLYQFRSFGSPGRVRDEDFSPELISKGSGIKLPPDHWIFDYIISISYYTLTEFTKVKVSKGPIDDDIQWWPVHALPKLLFDHKEIVQEALNALRSHILQYPVGYELLPEKFTLPELHSLYETILDKSIDSRNFTRKMSSTGIIKKLNETRSIGAHRSPNLYKFEKATYFSALKNGLFMAF